LGETPPGATYLVGIDEGLFEAAWVIFRQQRKSKLSFNYCTSIAVCRGNEISNVATLDEQLQGINAEAC